MAVTVRRRVLLLSFDFFREAEPNRSYALSCLRAAVAQDEGTRDEWAADAVSFDLSRERPATSRGVQALLDARVPACEYAAIAVGDYCWAAEYLEPALDWARSRHPGAFVLVGGYEATSTPADDVQGLYPSLRPGRGALIKGYAESSLLAALRALSSTGDVPLILEEPIRPMDLPSPWLAGTLPLDPAVKKVRWETKRGCPYKCDFCEFHRAQNWPSLAREMRLPRDRLFAELELFRAKAITKVNVLDPTFNMAGTYEDLLEPIIASGLDFAFQIRLEALGDDDVLIQAASGNPRLHFEIGVQTLNEQVGRRLKRHARSERILDQLAKLTQKHVSYETNLIFGIPGQTPADHLDDILKLRKAGCPGSAIKRFPLRIPRASQLAADRDKFEVEEIDPGSPHTKLVANSSSADIQALILLAATPELSESGLESVRRVVAGTLRQDVAAVLWFGHLVTFSYPYQFRLFVVEVDEVARNAGDHVRLLFEGQERRPQLHTAGEFIRLLLTPGDLPDVVHIPRSGSAIGIPARFLRHVVDFPARRVELYVQPLWLIELAGEAAAAPSA